MRDYQRRQTKYILPRAVYHQTLWRIRDYYRLKEVADDLIGERTGTDGERVQSSNIGDMVASTVIRRERFMAEASKIEKALKELPLEYQKGVWNNIMFGQCFPLDAGRATYGRYKSMFIYMVAENFGLI